MFALKDNCQKQNSKIYNVGIYVRLSREDEKSIESESIANQKDFLTRYVMENGWNLVDIFSDDGYTGTNFNRPDFKRLINDIENKKVNLVITKDLSRLGRDYIDTGYYIERYFPEHNIRYIALNDGVDTSENNSNNDMSPFKSVMNDLYAKDISKKVRTTMNSKRKNGEFIGAFAPYGYLKNPENKNKLVTDQEVAPIIKRIFDMYIAGSGYAHISHVLNEEAVLCPNAYKMTISTYNNVKAKLNLWTQETIGLIIKNPTYAGNITQNKYSKVSYKVKKLKHVSRDLWITVENTHEPIIDKETFELAQQIAAAKSNNNYSTARNHHLLTGLIFCQDCGERMTFTKTQKGEIYCICSKYKRFKLCSRHSYIERDLEQYIIDDLRKISRHAVNKEKLIQTAQAESRQTVGKNIDNERNAIERRLSEITKTIKFLYEDKLKGILTEQDFINLSKDYNQERDQLVLKAARIDKQKFEATKNQNNNDDLIKLIKDFAEFTNVSKQILLKLISRVEVAEDKKVTIHYNFKKHL